MFLQPERIAGFATILSARLSPCFDSQRRSCHPVNIALSLLLADVSTCVSQLNIASGAFSALPNTFSC